MMISCRALLFSLCFFLTGPCLAQDEQGLDNLVEKANDLIVNRQFQKAEPVLDKAMKLAEANKKLDLAVIDKLVQVYCAEKKWTEAEKLLETKGRIVWNSEAVDFRVAELLSKSGQNAEAYVILRKFVPQKISASAGISDLPSCGNATEDARRIRTLFFTTGYKSLALSEQELQEVEKNRQQKLKRWKAELKS